MDSKQHRNHECVTRASCRHLDLDQCIEEVLRRDRRVARHITDAHPNDWRAWWLAWRAAQNAADANAAREKTCTLLEANPAAIPIERCTRDATGGFAEDPRRVVFMSSTPRINECVVKFSKPADIAQTMSVEIDIDTRGSVTGARVTIGSAATNECVEHVLESLVFPKD